MQRGSDMPETYVPRKRNKKPRPRRYVLVPVVIIALFIIYVGVQVAVSLSKPVISTYEVTSQKITDSFSTPACCIRKEKLVRLDTDGYVTYFAADGERVGVNSSVYALDKTGSVKQQLEAGSEDVALSDDNYADIKNQIIDYKSSYSDSDFGSLYEFEYDLDNNITELTNASMVEKFTNLASADASLESVKSGEAGVISYWYDDLSDITEDTISDSTFASGRRSMDQVKSNDILKAGSVVYRLVTSDDWKIAIPLSDQQYDLIKDKKYLTVRILRDDLTVNRDVSFVTGSGRHFAVISLHKYMENYIDSRFLDVEVVLDTESGLKVPKSSLVSRRLYSIPEEYAVSGVEHKTGLTFYEKEKNGSLVPLNPEISYYDREKKLYYVSSQDMPPGTVLAKVADSSSAGSGSGGESYTTGESRKFTGVYLINRGYAQFAVVKKLYTGDDFIIAESGTSYGLSPYDHIILDSSSVKEGQIIY